MSRNKFNLKDKKTKIIIGSTIIIVLLLFIGIGLGLYSINNTDSKNIATQGQDKTDKKEESKKEDSTKEETKVESDKKEESTSEGTETSSKEESKSESSNTGSSSNSKPSSNSGSSSNSKPSTGGSSSNSKPSTGGSSSNSKPSSGGGSSNSGGTSKPEAHTHNWVAITQQVHHDEEGHWEDYIVSQAWTEEVPIYEEQYRAICNTCGADITGSEASHVRNHMLNGENGSYRNEPTKVQVGTNKIEHPAVTDKKWIVDKAAWTETVTTGHKCNSCGATK